MRKFIPEDWKDYQDYETNRLRQLNGFTTRFAIEGFLQKKQGVLLPLQDRIVFCLFQLIMLPLQLGDGAAIVAIQKIPKYNRSRQLSDFASQTRDLYI